MAEQNSSLMDERKTKGGPQVSSGASRLWIVVAIMFCLTTFGLVGVIIWRETTPRVTEVVTVEKRYPGYFRSQLEQEEFVQSYINASRYHIVNDTSTVTYNKTRVWNGNGYDTYIDGMQKRRRRRRRQHVELHACCETSISFEPKEFLRDIFGKKRKIAQFQDNKQFFKFESCRFVTSFPIGTCVQKQDLMTAVVEEQDGDTDPRYMIDWVKVPGCCKCVNIRV